MKINEVAVKQKAGIIPYYIDKDGLPRMMFMIPSDPAYGGSSFQIAKGFIDAGEDDRTAETREGAEELGLVESNIKHIERIASKVLTGTVDTYQMTVFAAEIIDPTNFVETDYETEERGWLTMEEYFSKGKPSHLSFVQQTHDYILRADGRDQVS